MPFALICKPHKRFRRTTRPTHKNFNQSECSGMPFGAAEKKYIPTEMRAAAGVAYVYRE